MSLRLKVACWNVQGLKPWKVNDNDFLNQGFFLLTLVLNMILDLISKAFTFILNREDLMQAKIFYWVALQYS